MHKTVCDQGWTRGIFIGCLTLWIGCLTLWLGCGSGPEPQTPAPSDAPTDAPTATPTPGPTPTLDPTSPPSPSPTGTPTAEPTPTRPTDRDRDGYPAEVDCNDRDAAIHPGAEEICEAPEDAPRDNDCDGVIDEAPDLDGDGQSAPATCWEGEDCDDGDPHTFAGAPEGCDGVDNDCDGISDAALFDLDGDGFLTSAPEAGCPAEGAGGLLGGDCDDDDPERHPGATEICDGIDNDCDRQTDDSDPDVQGQVAWYLDGDRDGFGDTAALLLRCLQPGDYVSLPEDCDDGDPSTWPGAPEEDCADPVDHNCDGSVGTQDLDVDGYVACEDCDDRVEGIHPGAAEVCGRPDAQGIDEDCDGLTDSDDPGVEGELTWYPDGDGDGARSAAGQTQSCLPPEGWLAETAPVDCDDADPLTAPGAEETCDEVDQDCDGASDEGVELTFYPDLDGDGYGIPGETVTGCSPPPGYAPSDDDCDDGDPALSPDVLWGLDLDADGYNGTVHQQRACEPPIAHAALEGDCDDDNPAVHPDATEYPGNGLDDDCDGVRSNVIAATAGYNFSLALDDQGTVWSWGTSNKGQLGTGHYGNNSFPRRITTLPPIVAVDAGYSHVLAIDVDGNLWAWGEALLGMLGNSDQTSQSRPVLVPEMTDLTLVSAGAGYSLVVDDDGIAWGFGANFNGNVGDGTQEVADPPRPVLFLDDVVQIHAGHNHSTAVQGDGSVWAWGDNPFGQLGDGTLQDRFYPAEALLDATALSAQGSEKATVILAESGVLYGCGVTEVIGYRSNEKEVIPKEVLAISSGVALSVAKTHALAVDADGNVWSWGDNTYDQLGGAAEEERYTPEIVPRLERAVGVAAGDYHSMAVMEDGSLWAWGSNFSLQLGIGRDTTQAAYPVKVFFGGG